MRSRNGMTILEVLFAIMITTVGLLGAISVFPVASEMARKGRLNDEVSVSADAAVHKFDAMGMRQPARWTAFIDQSATNQPALAVNGALLPATYPAAFWKTSFCIDPRFTAQNVTAHANNEQNWTRFPAYPQAVATSPRMQRLSLGSMGPNTTIMGAFQADHTFIFEDQLVYERSGVEKGAGGGADNSLPAFQIYSPIATNGSTLPGKRESEARASWFATLTPKMDLMNGLASDYVLSIVVLDRRSPALVTRDFNLPVSPLADGNWPDNEWTVSIAGADFYGNGFGGGEVRLNADYAEKLNSIRSGSWIMLAGNVGARAVQNGTDPQGKPVWKPTELAQVFRWYKVSDVGDIDTAVIGGVTRFVREATIVGADWDVVDVIPYGAASTLQAGGDGVMDDIDVVVVPGVVAVYERTVRLETDGNGF